MWTRPSFIRRNVFLVILLLGCTTSARAGQDDLLDKDEIRALVPTPSDLGEGWSWSNPGRPISDLGFQLTAYYSYRDPADGQADTPVVDMRRYASEAKAQSACGKALVRRQAGDQVIVDKEPSLGDLGFLSHYEPHAEFGRRVTFCVRNVFITIGPSHHGLKIATELFAALQ